MGSGTRKVVGNVGGAMTLAKPHFFAYSVSVKRGFSSPSASTKRRMCPFSTSNSIGSLVVPITLGSISMAQPLSLCLRRLDPHHRSVVRFPLHAQVLAFESALRR